MGTVPSAAPASAPPSAPGQQPAEPYCESIGRVLKQELYRLLANIEDGPGRSFGTLA